jgi:hypothetical protein
VVGIDEVVVQDAPFVSCRFPVDNQSLSAHLQEHPPQFRLPHGLFPEAHLEGQDLCDHGCGEGLCKQQLHLLVAPPVVKNGEGKNQGLHLVETESVHDLEECLGVPAAKRAEVNGVGDAEESEGDFVADLASQGLDLFPCGVRVVENLENLRPEEPAVDRSCKRFLDLVDQSDSIIGYHGAFLSREIFEAWMVGNGLY